MKHLIALILCLSFSAHAGEIVNEITGEKMVLELNKEAQEVALEGHFKNGFYEETIKLEVFDKNKDAKALENKKADIFTNDGRKVFGVVYGWANNPDDLYGGILGFPFSLGMDVLFWPYRIPNMLITKSQVKKDLAVIEAALIKDESVTVTKRRFRRVREYFFLQQTEAN